MSFSEKRDWIVNGMDSTNGGIFQQIKVNGQGTVDGDVECDSLTVSGNMNIQGKLQSETLKVNGRLSVHKEVVSEHLVTNGLTKINKDITIKNVEINGELNGNQNLSAEKTHLFGSLRLVGNCEAETFNGRGVFQIQGLLNADQIEVTLYGKSYAKEIGGESIRISSRKNILNEIFSWFQSECKTNLIEGDHIYLENTIANVVRGNHITIGKNCKIDRVEYKVQFEQKENAKVKESIKI